MIGSDLLKINLSVPSVPSDLSNNQQQLLHTGWPEGKSAFLVTTICLINIIKQRMILMQETQRKEMGFFLP